MWLCWDNTTHTDQTMKRTTLWDSLQVVLPFKSITWWDWLSAWKAIQANDVNVCIPPCPNDLLHADLCKHHQLQKPCITRVHYGFQHTVSHTDSTALCTSLKTFYMYFGPRWLPRATLPVEIALHWVNWLLATTTRPPTTKHNLFNHRGGVSIIILWNGHNWLTDYKQ